jgi:hypothetical protein
VTHSDKFKYLHDLICDVKSLITDLEDRDKVSAVIDSLIDYHNDFNYADNVNPCMYLDTGIYAIIDNCGFGDDLANVMCRPSSERRIRILAKLGQLMTERLYTVKWYIGNFEPEEQNVIP